MAKILYLITQSEFGGSQRYVFDLARIMSRDSQVAVAFGEQGADGELARRLAEQGIAFHIIPHLKRDISFANDIFAIIEMVRLINRFQPDIVHLNSSKISILGSLAAWISRSKINNPKLRIIYTVHGWVFTEPMPAWKRTFYRRLEKFTARFKDKIICIDRFDYDLAKKVCKIKSKKLKLIHHGLNTANIHPQSIERSQEILFQSIGGLSEQFKPEYIIGSIGHLYKTKGYEYLIEAIRLVKHTKHNFAVIIIGEGKERPMLEKLIRKHHLENHFILAGAISNAADLLSAFNIYVCTSVKEGFPYSILEAMYSGLPIISTNVGGIPDMIKDGVNGLLVDPGQANDMADDIIELLNNLEFQERLGRQARQDVIEKFSLEKMAADTKATYNGK